MDARFAFTLALLDTEIDALTRRLDALRKERGEIAQASGNSMPSKEIAKPSLRERFAAQSNMAASRLTVRAAIRRALDDGAPLTVKEIGDRVKSMPVTGKTTSAILRSTLHRLSPEEGWEKLGFGQNVRWKATKPAGAPAHT
jgi:hypothetical protein